MVIRIAGINLPDKKRVEVAITYVYGIGPNTAKKIMAETGVSPSTRVHDLTESEANRLREYIEKNLKVEGELKREVSSNIQRLQEIGSYRGMRHKRRLPVHGQRTKTNARTKRGKRVTVGSGRKKAAAKT
jgi:small subunit ribosomal protein S13